MSGNYLTNGRSNKRGKSQTPGIFRDFIDPPDVTLSHSIGAAISIFKLLSIPGRLVQSLAFLIAALIGLSITHRLIGRVSLIGLGRRKLVGSKIYLWFGPIILIETVALGFGLKPDLTLAQVVVYFVFTVAVGFTEELYFRGLIANILKSKGYGFAILLSSGLFSIGHFLNLLAGASLYATLSQVVFALIFGLVAVELYFLSSNLWIPIIWHSLQNFISLLTPENTGPSAIYIGLFQGSVLLAYAVYLASRLRRPYRVSDE